MGQVLFCLYQYHPIVHCHSYLNYNKLIFKCYLRKLSLIHRGPVDIQRRDRIQNTIYMIMLNNAYNEITLTKIQCQKQKSIVPNESFRAPFLLSQKSIKLDDGDITTLKSKEGEVAKKNITSVGEYKKTVVIWSVSNRLKPKENRAKKVMKVGDCSVLPTSHFLPIQGHWDTPKSGD